VYTRGQAILLRDPNDPSGGNLRIRPDELRAFVRRARDGKLGDVCAPAQVPELSPREGSPPDSQVDAEDRLSLRMERNPDWYNRQIGLENHRDKLKTRQMLRDLVFYGGLMGLSAVITYLLREAHFAAADAVRFGIVSYISCLGGTGAYRLIALFTQKIPNSIRNRGAVSRDSDIQGLSQEH
jgi:hypothetical protein